MNHEVDGSSPSALQIALAKYPIDGAAIKGLDPSQILEEAYKAMEAQVMGSDDVPVDFDSAGDSTTFRAVLASEAIIDRYGVDAYAHVLQHCKDIGMSDAYAADLLDLGNGEPRVIQKLLGVLEADMPRPQPSPTRLVHEFGIFPQANPLAFNPEPVDMRPIRARMQLLQSLRQMLAPAKGTE